MIKHSPQQTGSAHVAVVAILIVALIGALGFIFWQNFTAKNVKTDSATQVTTSQKADNMASTSTDRYTTLEDWGVKFKADDSLKATSIVQSKQKEQGSDGRDYYVISTARMDAAAKKSCPSRTDATGPALYRLQEKPEANADGKMADMMSTLVNNAPVNGYYYVLVQFGSTCPDGQSAQASDNSFDGATEIESILASLRTIQPVK